MSCRAILHNTGKEAIPLLLVRSGELTPRQCDHEFKGATGECPTCMAMIERAELGDGSAYAQAMLALQARGQSVSYKRFGYGSDGGVEPWRVCYWGHPPGYWAGVQFRDCQNANTSVHAVHLDVIRKYYQKSFRPEDGFVIKVEQRLRKPGDPPQPYSPDLAIYGPNNQRMVAVEYQRSFESYEKFCERDDLRRAEKWPAVDWWFDDTQSDIAADKATVYGKSQMHRTHLALMSVLFYRCWVDPCTLQLKAEHGRCGDLPIERRKHVERKIEKAELAECSTAQLMRQIEQGPERELIKDFVRPMQVKAGSELDFRAHADWSLEREKRLALAVMRRRLRLEEQDRRDREWLAEQRRKERDEQEKAAVRLRFQNETILRRADEARIRREEEWELSQRQEQERSRQKALLAFQTKDALAKLQKWGIPVGSVGHVVRWTRDKPFTGVIDRWIFDRPVILNTQTARTRLAFDASDYQLLS